MARLDNIFAAMRDENLTKKFAAQCLISAVAVRSETESTDNHANRLAWAENVIGSIDYAYETAGKILWIALAMVSVAQNNGADMQDGQIATSVNSVIGSAGYLAKVV